jgi:hypothetical protein
MRLHIYMAHSPLLFAALCCFSLHPFVFPLYTPLLTWHPPFVIGIVHLPLRLLVNWPRLPHPSPSWPTLPKFPASHLPRAQQWRPREYSDSCCPEHVQCAWCDFRRKSDVDWGKAKLSAFFQILTSFDAVFIACCRKRINILHTDHSSAMQKYRKCNTSHVITVTYIFSFKYVE